MYHWQPCSAQRVKYKESCRVQGVNELEAFVTISEWMEGNESTVTHDLCGHICVLYESELPCSLAIH